MGFNTTIANRFIFSKKSKFLSIFSTITILGISLGTVVLIIALSVLNGFEDAISNKIVNFNSHIKVTGFSGKPLNDFKSFSTKIESLNIENIANVSPFISQFALLKDKEFSQTILLTGIDPKDDNSGIINYIREGNYFSEGKNDSELLIGKRLAEKLRLKISDKLIVFGFTGKELPTIMNPPRIKQFTVIGIYESSMAEYDDNLIYSTLESANYLFQMNGNVTGFNIKVHDISKIEMNVSELKSHFRYPYYFRSIFSEYIHIFSWLELQKKPIPIILGLIILVAVFNIVGTTLITILEKYEQIGILKSIGASNFSILKIFILYGFYISACGIVIGNAAALILSLVQNSFNIIQIPGDIYYLSNVPLEINPAIYLFVSVIGLLLGVIAALAPAMVASKFSTVKVLNFR